jgi:hypothetical protein
LSAAFDARLRQLPLKRPGFEERTRQADWVFLGLWPIGDDLAPVIEQRAGDIAFLILRKHQPRPATKPSEAARDVALKFRAFAKAWRDLPEGAAFAQLGRLVAGHAQLAEGRAAGGERDHERRSRRHDRRCLS